MPISWDENQLPALVSWIEKHLPLVGSVSVTTMDIPANCFAGLVDLSGKEFTVYANPETSLFDTTVNIFLGYIVALAYDRNNWTGMPTHEVLFDCHQQVCNTLKEFNGEFSSILEEYSVILSNWHSTHANPDTSVEDENEEDDEDLITSMSSSLFSVNPDDSKDYGAN